MDCAMIAPMKTWQCNSMTHCNALSFIVKQLGNTRGDRTLPPTFSSEPSYTTVSHGTAKAKNYGTVTYKKILVTGEGSYYNCK